MRRLALYSLLLNTSFQGRPTGRPKRSRLDDAPPAPSLPQLPDEVKAALGIDSQATSSATLSAKSGRGGQPGDSGSAGGGDGDSAVGYRDDANHPSLYTRACGFFSGVLSQIRDARDSGSQPLSVTATVDWPSDKYLEQEYPKLSNEFRKWAMMKDDATSSTSLTQNPHNEQHQQQQQQQGQEQGEELQDTDPVDETFAAMKPSSSSSSANEEKHIGSLRELDLSPKGRRSRQADVS